MCVYSSSKMRIILFINDAKQPKRNGLCLVVCVEERVVVVGSIVLVGKYESRTVVRLCVHSCVCETFTH